MDRIYFDYASTTPVDPAVIRAMEPFWHERFGNASSPHGFGRDAQKAVEDSRERLAVFLNAQSDEIIFNSGATEGNNHAVIGIARALREKGDHIIVSSIEHHSVLEPVEYLKNEEGFQVTTVKVDANGLVNPEDVGNAMTDRTILVAVMMASNEIGTIQPIAEIGHLTRQKQILFLVDAVQVVGHIPVDVKALKADLLSLSAHKFYGPKGVGALYIRKGVELTPLLMGGGQERGWRASTQNVAGIVGLAKAVELCAQQMPEEMVIQGNLRDRIIAEIPNKIEGVKVNGHLKRRLPNNIHFAFERIEGESLLMSLDMAHVAASMGSACTSGSLKASHVLRAIGLSDELAYGALRITLGRWTSKKDVDYLIEKLPGLVGQLRI